MTSGSHICLIDSDLMNHQHKGFNLTQPATLISLLTQPLLSSNDIVQPYLIPKFSCRNPGSNKKGS